MQAKNRRIHFTFAALGCLLVVVGVLFTACKPSGRGVPSPSTSGGGSGGGDATGGDTSAGKPLTLPAALAVALDEQPRAVSSRLTASWSVGPVSIVPEAPSFAIERDYNQRVVLHVENRGSEARRIIAELGRLEHGLLGGFVGPGSADEPVEVAAQGKAQLDLYLFAQDAELRSYRTHVTLKDADRGELLAVAPISILVPLPTFKLDARIGQADPATLALPVTLVNQGGAVSDLTVAPGRSLLGQVVVAPTMDHVALSQGAQTTFWVHPRLSTSFRTLEGDLVLRGAGQQQTLKLHFELPEGQRVFVARSFSTTSDGAAGGFCTNNPNTSTNVGGPGSDSSADDWHLWPEEASRRARDIFGDQDIPGLPMDTSGRFKTGGKVGPFNIGFDAGAAPGSDPRGPIVDSNLTVKVGPYGKTLHTEVSVSPKVQDDLSHVSSPQRPQGRQLGGIDEGSVNYGEQGGAKNRPRGRSVRAAYLRDRPDIESDNSPEAMLAVGPGAASERLLVEAWHSDVWCGRGGRQIALRVWDGFGMQSLSRVMLLSPEDKLAQWPAVLVLPESRALVVFEMAAERDAPPSLFYRVSGPGFDSWSPGILVPGAAAEGEVGHYDPVAAFGPDGRITLVWQVGDGADSTIRISHNNDEGTFAEPTTPDGLPAGAARPVARVTANGALHLAFQAGTQEGGASAVYYARSVDGGATLDALQRISPEGMDAGEPDLVVRGDDVHAVFRVGPDWESRIHHTASHDGGATWAESVAISPDDTYAEFASLYLPVSGESTPDDATASPAELGVEFFAGRRSQANEPGAMIERFHSELRGGFWSQPERLLTNFPTVQETWLQVNFRLKTTRLKYRPHDLSLLFNGFELLRLENAVPEGTYLLPVHPGLLSVDRSGLPHNVIELRTRHMNPGSYSNAADFRLLTRHKMLERFVVASDQAEADARLAAESPTINHARADVGLFSTYTPTAIPASPTVGETITLPLVVGNLGEAPADDARVEVFERSPTNDQPTGEPLGESIEVGRLSPMELKPITIRFPYGGKEQYVAVARSSGDDFDAKNNSHVISFAVAPPPPTPPRTATADLVDLIDDPDPPYLCRILDADSGDEIQRINRGKLAGPIPPGKYRLALTRYEREGMEVLFPQVFDLGGADQKLVTLRTAIELDVPRDAGPIDRWELVKADEPDSVVQWHFGRHPVMLVPLGHYRVAVYPTSGSDERMVLEPTIELAADEHRVLRLGSGIRLEVPDRIAPITSWAILRGDETPEVVQTFEGAAAANRLALVPPGEYRVAFAQSGGEAVLWPQTAEVREGTFAVLRIPPTAFAPSNDLRGWKPAGPAATAKWTLFPDGRGVTLTHEETTPAFFISPESYGDVAMRCSIRVDQENPSIRGVVGLVLGYQGPLSADDPDFEFIMLKWSNELSVPSRDGMYLVRVKGTFSENHDKLFYLVEPECEILARSGEPDWTPGKQHALEVRYESKRIQVALDGQNVLEAEGEFAPGRVGFHGFGYGDAVSFSGVTLKPLSNERAARQTIEGWGVAIDPAGDCTIGADTGRLTITVPGTNHNLNPEPEYDNVLAPRVLQTVEGDFAAEVKVDRFARPEANTSATPQGHSYVAGGLLLWWNEKTFVRCFRAANGQRGDLFIHVEAFRDGKRQDYRILAGTRLIPDEATYLRAERNGDDFTFSWSTDGESWVEYARLSAAGIPAKLDAGVAVVNATNKEFSAQFDEFLRSFGPDRCGSDSGPNTSGDQQRTSLQPELLALQ